ncbi:hypothetical protein HDF26_003426 [Pedobacter cryoconitis]|uniref:outer membrane beta-barrel protein n=1 Tax=Pedobacter cryoconitis TaxID=188932 RepID=UPI00161D634F|nr:outer membrane beta-barrel protein [Pedobacter cryoconitis]MBB6272966.1 hypothetical protein [Pedobacter cryoconitis]
MKLFLLGILLSISALSFAQSNFQKGYVVNNEKDTLRGYIDYKEWDLNPGKIAFKTDLDAGIQDFTVKNSLAWAVTGFEIYQKYEVEVSMSQVDVSRLSVGRDNSKAKSVVFLKVLQTGKNATLFSYTDGIKQRFYLLEKDESIPYELGSQLYMKSKEDNLMVTDNQYIRQLGLVMTKLNVGTEAERHSLEISNYGIKPIMNAVAVINEQQLIKTNKNSAVRFFAGAGLNMSRAHYKGDTPFALPGAESKVSLMPLITAGFDLFANPAIGKLIYRAELSLLMGKHEATIREPSPSKTYMTHTFNQFTINITPQIIYNFYNTNRLKAFVGGGPGLNFSGYSNNKTTLYSNSGNETELTSRKIDLEKFNFSFPFTAGLVFNKKVEISAGYAFASPITNYSSFSINMQRYRVGVNYLFGKL